jgi:hypothetical protein
MTFGLSGNMSCPETMVGGADISHLLQKAKSLPLAPKDKKKVAQAVKSLEQSREDEKMPARDLRAQYGN